MKLSLLSAVTEFVLFCVEILGAEVVFGLLVKPMTRQVECYMITIYKLTFAVDNHMCNTAIFRQLVMVGHSHTLSMSVSYTHLTLPTTPYV